MPETNPPASPGPPDAPAPLPTPENRLRRQLLKALAGTVAVGTATWFGWTRFLFPPRRHGLLLGPVTNFKPGAPPTLIPNTDNAQYAIQNTGQGEFLVLSAICTHQGCSVAWDARAGNYLCPCHLGRYDTSGKVIGGPPPRPLPSLPNHVQGDMLYLNS